MKISRNINEDPIEKAYHQHFESLYSYAVFLTRSQDLAKDVVSEVFINLIKAKTDLNSIKRLRSYLFTCVRNQAIRMKTSDPYFIESEKVNFEYIDKISPEEILIGKELEQFLHRTISDLPPRCRLVFRLVKEERMKYEEVAKELNITADTVKYHLKTAVKAIKTKLKDHFEENKVIHCLSSDIIGLFFILLCQLLPF